MDRSSRRQKVLWKDTQHYTAQELESELFARLRQEAEQRARDDHDVAAVHEQVSAALHAGSDEATADHDLTPPTIEEETVERRASRVWFLTNDDAFCFERADHPPEGVPLIDTFGGNLGAEDDGSYSRCAMREVNEATTLPSAWASLLQRAISLDPDGQELVRITLSPPHKYHVAVWYIRLTNQEAKETPPLTSEGQQIAATGSLRWRPHGEVMSNLSNFTTHLGLTKSMKKWMVPLSSRVTNP